MDAEGSEEEEEEAEASAFASLDGVRAEEGGSELFPLHFFSCGDWREMKSIGIW